MSRKEWYTIDSKRDHFIMRKVDDNFETTGHYIINKPDNTPGKEKVSHCDCFAGLQGKFCRHKQMIPIFEQANAFNTGRLYNFDKQLWREPKQQVDNPLVDLDNLEM